MRIPKSANFELLALVAIQRIEETQETEAVSEFKDGINSQVSPGNPWHGKGHAGVLCVSQRNRLKAVLSFTS